MVVETSWWPSFSHHFDVVAEALWSVQANMWRRLWMLYLAACSVGVRRPPRSRPAARAVWR